MRMMSEIFSKCPKGLSQNLTIGLNLKFPAKTLFTHTNVSVTKHQILKSFTHTNVSTTKHQILKSHQLTLWVKTKKKVRSSDTTDWLQNVIPYTNKFYKTIDSANFSNARFFFLNRH
jgi:hypothetical protein